MRVSELKELPQKAIEILEKDGIKELNPPQELAIKAGLLLGKNMVVSAPTASGKTLIAELAIINAVLNKKKKAVYIAPLKALGSEKYRDFKKRYGPLGLKIALSMGDFDAKDSRLSENDVIISTSEKLDSLLRHKAEWVKDIGLVIADEIHLIGDMNRGPTLEVVIARMKMLSDFQILALSATISNASEIAQWLQAELVESKYRPVKVARGIFCENKVAFADKTEMMVPVSKRELKDFNEFKDLKDFKEFKELKEPGESTKFKEFKEFKNFKEPKESKDSIHALVKHILLRKKQALIFLNSRPSAELLAEQLIATVKDSVKNTANYTLNDAVKDTAKDSGNGNAGPENPESADIAEPKKILWALEQPTRQCRRLANCVKAGVAFHHAGLVRKQREEVEELFKKGKIRVICATPTLAAGVNLPSTYVIIRDTYRYQSGYGMKPLPFMEIEQMCGRAGRPRYDSEGYAIIAAKNKRDAERLFGAYFTGETEKIFSFMSLEPALRMHILAIIATGDAKSEDEVIDFLGKTFYAHQYSDMEGIRQIVKQILENFIQQGLVAVERAIERECDGEGECNNKSIKLGGTHAQHSQFGALHQNAQNSQFFTPASDYLSQLKAEETKNTIKATALGKRVSELYIDPETARLFFESIKNLSLKSPPIAFLHLAAYTHEMRPLLSIKSSDEDWLFSSVEEIEPHLAIPKERFYDKEEFFSSLKSALVLDAWANEWDEDAIMEKFGATPGDIRARILNADWVLYSMRELCTLLLRRDILAPIDELRLRIKYGAKKEILPLVRIKGIGRIRARRLFNAGIKNTEDIKNARYEFLKNAIGPAAAGKLKEMA